MTTQENFDENAAIENFLAEGNKVEILPASEAQGQSIQYMRSNLHSIVLAALNDLPDGSPIQVRLNQRQATRCGRTGRPLVDAIFHSLTRVTKVTKERPTKAIVSVNGTEMTVPLSNITLPKN